MAHPLAPELHKAVEQQDFRLIKRLLFVGAGVNAKTEDLRTPLHVAARINSYKIAHYFAKLGAKINEKDQHGLTPLHIACELQSLAVVELLLSFGGDVSAREKAFRDTVMHIAAQTGNPAIVSACMKRWHESGNKSVIQSPGMSTAHRLHASYRRAAAVLSTWAGTGASTKRCGSTSPGIVAATVAQRVDVHGAVSHESAHGDKDPHEVQYQPHQPHDLSHDVPDASNTQDGTLLGEQDLHSSSNSSLLSLHAEPSVSIRHPLAPIHTLSTATRHWGLLRSPQSTVGPHPDINHATQFVNRQLQTPLHTAANLGHGSVVRVLLLGGADAAALDSQGRLPLHYAAQHGHVAVMRMLLLAGSPVLPMDAQDLRPLDLAIMNGDVRAVELLLHEVPYTSRHLLSALRYAEVSTWFTDGSTVASTMMEVMNDAIGKALACRVTLLLCYFAVRVGRADCIEPIKHPSAKSYWTAMAKRGRPYEVVAAELPVRPDQLELIHYLGRVSKKGKPLLSDGLLGTFMMML